LSPLWDQVITFHTAAKAHSTSSNGGNLDKLWLALATPLGALALYGTLVSLVRRDWRVLPLIAWFLAVFYLLWQQVPLFHHHVVTLMPPLILLATMSLGPWPVIRVPSRLRFSLLQYPTMDRGNEENLTSPLTSSSVDGSNRTTLNRLTVFALGNSIIIIALLCVTTVYFVPILRSTYQAAQRQGDSTKTHMSLQVAHDVDTVTQPDQLVITDAPFLVAEADRSTPPQLVDTSFVRIQSGYLSDQQLTQLAEQSNVHTVLFYTGRLRQMPGFRLWVSQHFHKVRNYGNGRELWVRME
jgi:hypothetical protein